MTTQKGFTLVELMVVIAIIGILAAAAIPSYLRFMGRSRRAELYNGLAGIHSVQSAYFASHDMFKVGSLDCGAQAPANWDRNFSIGGFYNLSSPAKFYGFCMEVLPNSFIGRGAGNIDNDATLDIGQVTDVDRSISIILDDLTN